MIDCNLTTRPVYSSKVIPISHDKERDIGSRSNTFQNMEKRRFVPDKGASEAICKVGWGYSAPGFARYLDQRNVLQRGT